MVNENHGRWYNAASQGSVYWGTTGNVLGSLPIYNSTAPTALLYNAANSGVMVEMISLALTWAATTATTVIGGFAIGYTANPAAPTSLTPGLVTSMPINGVSPGNQAKIYGVAALSVAPTLLAGLGLQVQNTSGANNFGGISEVEFDGTLILAPGSLITVGGTVGVAEANYIVDMQWAEWPL